MENTSHKDEQVNNLVEPGLKGKALIVDDEATNRLVLNALLSQIGFSVVEAEDGLQALDQFKAEDLDIVFMDIMMPGMDGYEATAKIKQLCGDRFVPVIVLTAISDEDALAKCIEVGGDDLLTKPFEAQQLKSKIHAMMRIRELHSRVALLYTRMQQDEELAEKLFSRAVTAKNIGLDQIRTLLRPAGLFSGDAVLTDHGPNGDLHVLLGDFTGHGLTAAIGALPASEVFRSMIAKGFYGREVLAAINTKLCSLLPDGMFMAASYIHIPRDLSCATIFNCGLPDVLVIDETSGLIKQRIKAHHFALGLDVFFPATEEFERLLLKPGDRVLMYSDGLTESRNHAGDEFGDERLENIINGHAIADTSFDRVVMAADEFSQGCPQHDDISLVEVPFIEEVLGSWVHRDIHVSKAEVVDGENHEQVVDSFKTRLTLQGRRLAQLEMIPLIMTELQENQLPQEVLSEIYTVLAELHSNALDHGVMGLDSSMKEAEEGFMEYFAERERQLTAIQEGFVEIDMQVFWYASGGRVVIGVEDSGPGFNLNHKDGDLNNETAEHGRGISLVRELCDSLRYEEPGNKVEAVYSWTE